MKALPNPARTGPRNPDDQLESFSDLLLDGLRALAKAGEVDAACSIAGRAHALVRNSRPGIAQHFNVFLHRQISHLTWTEPQQRFDHAGSSGKASTDLPGRRASNRERNDP